MAASVEPVTFYRRPRSAIICLCAGATDFPVESNSLKNTLTAFPATKTGRHATTSPPTQTVPVVRQNPTQPIRELSLIRWGLIPSWAKDSSAAAQMINARSETAATKPAFRDALQFRRCLIPADGFYEWQREGKNKQPYCFQVNDGELFAFAGIWERWKDPRGNAIETCSILTTTPNAATAAVHDRMPVILAPDDYDFWLYPGMRNVAAASDLLKAYDARLMRCYPVSTRINHAANDDESCSAPVELEQTQSTLF